MSETANKSLVAARTDNDGRCSGCRYGNNHAHHLHICTQTSVYDPALRNPQEERDSPGAAENRPVPGTGGRCPPSARPAAPRPAPSRQPAVSRRARNPGRSREWRRTRGNRSARPGSPGSLRPPRPTGRRRPPPPALLTRALQVVAGLHDGSPAPLWPPGPPPPPFRAAAGGRKRGSGRLGQTEGASADAAQPRPGLQAAG